MSSLNARLKAVRVEVPLAMQPLLANARYKAAHGGRGGTKSHFFAEQLILACYCEKTRGVCVREVQNTIKESVRQLLVEKIAKLKLEAFFEVLDGEIRGLNGSLITFKGMQSYNATNVKSLEGVDICWVEEAQTLSKTSLKMLRPTIRKPGSQIWFSWNPRHDTDAVDEFLRGKNPPKDLIIVCVNWYDNPWFPHVLKEEKDRDFLSDPEDAEHIWNGNYELVSEGAYFAKLILRAEKEGRIGAYPYNPKKRLRTAWDLGIADYTSIWFIQDNGTYADVVDFYEVSGEGFDDIIATAMPEIFIPPSHDPRFDSWSKEKALAQLGRDVPFAYHSHILPHDVRVREQGSGGRHRYQILEALGMKNLQKGVATNPDDRVKSVRSLLPRFRFDDNPRVQHGLKRLRRYRKKHNEQLNMYLGPLHDENSHAADAFGEYTLNSELMPLQKKVVKPVPKRNTVHIAQNGQANVGNSEAPTPKEFLEMIKRERKLHV